MGDASTLDVGYKPIPLYAGRKCRASVHVVQVLAPLADGGVLIVVDDLEASEARAMSMPSDDGTESSAISRSAADADITPSWLASA